MDVLDTVRCEYGMETAEFDACVRECKARLASYEPETLDVLAVDWDQLAREAMALLALAEPIRSFLEHGAEYDIPRGGIVGQIAAQLGKAPPYLRTTGDDERRRLWSAVRLYLAAPERGWEPTPSLTDLANNP